MCFYSQHKYWWQASKEILINHQQENSNNFIEALDFLAGERLKSWGNPFNQWGNLSKKHGEAKNIVGNWGVDKSHGEGKKSVREMLSWGVLLRGVMSQE